MENIEKGVIIFENYIVKKVLFELNQEYLQEEVDINLDVKANVSLSGDKSSMIVELKIDIFKDAVENHFPFHMELIIEGMFALNPQVEENEIEIYRGNAIAILFPYARAIVSTYTANTNVTPLILPTINVNSFLKREN